VCCSGMTPFPAPPIGPRAGEAFRRGQMGSRHRVGYHGSCTAMGREEVLLITRLGWSSRSVRGEHGNDGRNGFHSMLDRTLHADPSVPRPQEGRGINMDAYFSADVETDGPIPGPFSILSFALVYAGSFDGHHFQRPQSYERALYKELRPISDNFQQEALRVNRLDRDRLCREGESPEKAMTAAARWVREIAGKATPVLVAYPLSFDWTWLYWYFVQFSREGSPFDYSRCFDIKTAFAVKAGIPISEAGRSRLDPHLVPNRNHTHHALEDAIEQAEIFANLFSWEGFHGRTF
jgi:hypothetical protein